MKYQVVWKLKVEFDEKFLKEKVILTYYFVHSFYINMF